MKTTITETPNSWIINNRYEIYKDCGVVYDTTKIERLYSPFYIATTYNTQVLKTSNQPMLNWLKGV